ncbi:MAG: OmpA family protein [Bacteroidetes bacterium]|jgi:hypothetical protein|nr:OmpA family protein [Bacteroidota bacterium]MBT5527783.1 OmpA family protein [Cytophagia bacterium]MBT3423003.1 OmpA family protein [Bacteroidota bacterium]MBT3799722.1 OmpA family protein [Bacteroidota bacterium]MBT3933595.1 OmpA family protein [Bacteroidota bacterium]
MKYLILLLSFTISVFQAMTQEKSMELTIYFETNEYALNSQNQKSLDSFIKRIPGSDYFQKIRLRKISITGHTDNVADSIYNIQLSEKRSETIKQYLISKKLPEFIISARYYGENKPITKNVSDNERAQNRRVQITVNYSFQELNIRHEGEADVVREINYETDSCSKDTVVVLQQGTRLVMNICEYLKLKDIISFKEYVSTNAIRESGFTTMDSDGNTLRTGGMFSFNVKGDTCLNHPIVIRVPITRCNEGMKFYAFSAGGWILSNQKLLRIVRENGKRFYEFELICPMKMNLDVKIKKSPKRKFKTKEDLEIVSLKISTECPIKIVYSPTILKPKKKVKIRMKCPLETPYIYAKAINSKGDTLIMDYQPLTEILPRYAFGKCKTSRYTNHTLIGLFPIREKTLYKVYFLYPEDFNRIIKNEKAIN